MDIRDRSILAAALAGVVIEKNAIVEQKIAATLPGRYSIGDSELCVEWGWIHAGWGLSSKDDYIRWDDDGPLYDPRVWFNRQERGRQLILEHFGLERLTDDLPLAVIAKTSPAALFAMRRKLETTCGLECKNDMISNRAGDHCSAENCG